MSDRHEEKDGYGVDSSTSSTRGGAPRRGGYGDDQGTRVGEPDHPSRSESAPDSRAARPSTHAVDEGLEGSVLDESDDERKSRSTGAGSEASEGMHAAQQDHPRHTDRSSVERADTGRSSSDSDIERAGSEPLHGRTYEHESGYGGRGGEPRTSSDQRE